MKSVTYPMDEYTALTAPSTLPRIEKGALNPHSKPLHLKCLGRAFGSRINILCHPDQAAIGNAKS